jgi:hypothetical protein
MNRPVVECQTRRSQTLRTLFGEAWIACLMLCTIGMPFSLMAADTLSNPASPRFSVGYLVAYWVCNSRKRNAIGGYLLFFYWQVYSGLALSVLLFSMNIQSYVPENFDDKNLYLLFLASSVPAVVLFLVKCAVATLSLPARTWDMLKLLRWVITAELAVNGIGAAIDAVYFPDNLSLIFMTIGPNALWLIYLFRSKRVRHVFLLQDWDTAVNRIHPPKLNSAATWLR